IFDDCVSKLQELVALHLTCRNSGALLLVTNFPIADRLYKRTLKKAQCLVNRSRRSFDYGWLWTAAVDPRHAKILSLLVGYGIVAPVSVAGTVFSLRWVEDSTQRRPFCAPQNLGRIVPEAIADEYQSSGKGQGIRDNPEWIGHPLRGEVFVPHLA